VFGIARHLQGRERLEDALRFRPNIRGDHVAARSILYVQYAAPRALGRRPFAAETASDTRAARARAGARRSQPADRAGLLPGRRGRLDRVGDACQRAYRSRHLWTRWRVSDRPVARHRSFAARDVHPDRRRRRASHRHRSVPGGDQAKRNAAHDAAALRPDSLRPGSAEHRDQCASSHRGPARPLVPDVPRSGRWRRAGADPRVHGNDDRRRAKRRHHYSAYLGRRGHDPVEAGAGHHLGSRQARRLGGRQLRGAGGRVSTPHRPDRAGVGRAAVRRQRFAAAL
ncbi:MAG: cAMP-binding proteins - catabolite gene activator and regulatory subunit of cAMP-dependent protein kinases, partial [uncultured Sphingomonadaceae bacterium]